MYTVVAAVFYSAGTPLLFVYLVKRFKDIGKGGDTVVSNALGWMARHSLPPGLARLILTRVYVCCSTFPLQYEPYRAGKEWPAKRFADLLLLSQSFLCLIVASLLTMALRWLGAEMVRVNILTSLIGVLSKSCWMKLFSAQIVATVFLCIFLYCRPCTFYQIAITLDSDLVVLTLACVLFFYCADRRSSHNLMQGLAMVAPVMSMGWGLAGGWEAVEVDGGSAEAHSDKEESAYDGIAMVALHVTLIAPPLVISQAEVDELVEKARKCLDLTWEQVRDQA